MKHFVILLLVLLSFNACKKEDKGPQLPPQTHEGKNIIAWKMDGQVYVSEGSEYFAGNNSAYYIAYDTQLYIRARTKVPESSLYLLCVLRNTGVPSTFAADYPFKGNILDFSNPAGGSVPTGGNQYQTDDTRIGSVIVTYYDSSIIAGSFQMDVVNDAGVVRHITEGQFDIKSE